MNIFLVGDVHGCLGAFVEMVERYWRPDEELFVQVGDLIDRGAHSPEVVVYAQDLLLRYPERVVFLKGNHEFEATVYQREGGNDNWYGQCGKETLEQYASSSVSFEKHVAWFEGLPLFWENETVFASHAGVSTTDLPFVEENMDGVLWNRGTLKNIGKVQVFGHTPTVSRFPEFDGVANTWNIDGGTSYGRNLCGLRLAWDGTFLGSVVIGV